MSGFVINNQWALGDTICMSALVRDLHLAYQGQYPLHMTGHYQSYWRHCPYAKIMQGDPRARVVKPQYIDGIKAAGQGSKIHFLSWFHKDFEKQVGIRVPVTKPRGEIWLPPEMTNTPPYPFRYWVVVAGCKSDMTVKQWDIRSWQHTVTLLKKLGITCVQAGADFSRHFHARLNDVEQAIGKTDDIADFFRLIYHSDGVICGITAAMHAAAAMEKPCVVIAGGREEPWWESYTNCYAPFAFGDACAPVRVEHTFLHTVGLLDCCQNKGCWKDRTVPIDADDHTNARKRSQLCKYPLKLAKLDVPKCMDMIKTDHVVEAVMNYYEKGFLPPIGEPRKKYALVSVGGHEFKPTDAQGRPMIVHTPYPLYDSEGKQVGWHTPEGIKWLGHEDAGTHCGWKGCQSDYTGPVAVCNDPTHRELAKKEPAFTDQPQKMIEFSVFEQVGVGRGPVGLEPTFQAIDNLQAGKGVITDYRVDHSTYPPTEHVTIEFPDEHMHKLAKAMPQEFKPVLPEDPALAILDNPIIGGKFTVCILGYGDNHKLMERCLGSILANTPAHRLDIRVALNQPSKALMDYVYNFDKGVITQIYMDRGDRKKYPAMREMFWDDCCPIRTNYVLWFDDDSHVIDKKWLVKLGDTILKNHLQGCRLYGTKFVHDLMSYKRAGFNPENWFQSADWWKNVWMHMGNGERLGPNGHQIVFATGGFWALATEVIRAANIPDVRLIHNGGDITIGEQVHQAGFKVCDFARNKTPVCWSDARPRGASHQGPAPKEFPWSKHL